MESAKSGVQFLCLPIATLGLLPVHDGTGKPPMLLILMALQQSSFFR